MYYFASDTHLGLRVGRTADDRERLFVRWLDEVSADAEGIFLVGDIFDFWYEYKRVVPRGFTRLLGKLSGLTDRGIPVLFFAGNHDLWAYDYLRSECGVTLHRGPFELFDLYGQKVLVGHGDVLGPRGRGGRCAQGRDGEFPDPGAGQDVGRAVDTDLPGGAPGPGGACRGGRTERPAALRRRVGALFLGQCPL